MRRDAAVWSHFWVLALRARSSLYWLHLGRPEERRVDNMQNREDGSRRSRLSGTPLCGLVATDAIETCSVGTRLTLFAAQRS